MTKIKVCSSAPIIQQHRGMGDISKKWYNGKFLTVSFLDGTEELQQKVINIAKTWSEYANIKFEQVRRHGDIRITFESGGSWSYIGTDSEEISKLEPTMQLGWISDKTSCKEIKRVVLHEFGHALGLLHEHQNPAGGIQWNVNKVMKYYRDNQGWNDDAIITNVLNIQPSQNYLTDKFDEKSIMLYPVSSELTLNGYSTGWNSDISQGDIEIVRKMYPK